MSSDLEQLHTCPIKKQLTEMDVSSGELTLPVQGVEDYIIPRLPVDKRETLRNAYGKIDICVFDVDREIRYDMELARKKKGGGYKLREWDQVSLPRNIRAGNGIGMSWSNGTLYFRIFSA